MAAPRLIVVADANDVARTAAERVMGRIDANPGRIAICLTGGSSPKQLYRLLATDAYRRRIPWQRVHWFIGDERFVPPGDPLNNMSMARSSLLDGNAPQENVHPIPTQTATPDASAQAYELELRTFYGATELAASRPLFDVVLMGAGPDGHTASLFPGYPATEVRDRWVVGVPNAHIEPFVPRVTLTFQALASCREMLFEITGTAKRPMLTRMLAGEDLPTVRARSNEETVWLVDQAALPEGFRAKS